MLKSRKSRKKILDNLFLYSSIFFVVSSEIGAFAAGQAKQASGGNSSMMLIVAGVIVAVVIGVVAFVAMSKKDKGSVKTGPTPPQAKNTSLPSTPKVQHTPTPKAPIAVTPTPVAPAVPKKESSSSNVSTVSTSSMPQSAPVQTPSFNPPSPVTPPKMDAPPMPAASSPSSQNKLFDSSKLDSDLDSIFTGDSASAPKEAPAKKAPLFDSDQLDSDLDSLFVEVNKQVEKPKEEKKGLFNSSQLDSDLDSLFSDSSKPASTPAPSSAPSNDFSSLFGTPTDMPKVETPSPTPAFNLDSLDFLSSETPKEEPKKQETSLPSFDLSSLNSSTAPKVESPASTPAFNLDSLDFLSSETPKEEPKKEEPFKLPSFDLSSITGSSSEPTPVTEPPKTTTIPLMDQKIDLSTTTMGINISDYLSSISGAKKEDAPAEEDKKKQKSDGIISIGKMLVDQNALEEIIKKAEKGGKAGLTTTQVITAVKGRSLDTLLVDINNIDGIMGSIIVGKDGLVIANTMPPDIDKDLVGALTSSLFSNIDVQVKKMKKGTLKRLTVETEMGTYVLTEIEMGTLVVFSEEKEKIKLAELFKAITTLTGKA